MTDPITSAKDEDGSGAFLGVSSSLKGQKWLRRPFLPRTAGALADATGLPLLVCELLASRGQTLESVDDFLSPTLKTDLPDPSLLLDMDKAANRIADAIETGGSIGIFGDYDVDGATSSALFVDYFSALNVPVLTHIPDRMTEGYGPNAPALLGLKSRGAKLVITVDCGTLSFAPLEAAAEAKIDVIVCDHHKAEPILPPAFAVVNPNRLDDTSDLGQLAAVGVSFLMLVAVNRILMTRGYFDGCAAPDLLALLDLVALGTVCDVVPLTGVNRTFVHQGLKVMARRQRIGLSALGDVARMDDKPSVYHLGFLLGPRVNAGGRVGESSLGLKVLTATDPNAAREMAETLDHYNEERRRIEQEVLDAAMLQAEELWDNFGGSLPLMLVAGDGWHAGVIGIVASRIKDKYGLPTFVIAIDGALAKGSGRSISGVDLGAGVIEAQQQGLLVAGGGHAMAAGLTIETEKIEELRTFLSAHLKASVEDAAASRALMLDGVIAPSGLNADLVDQVDAAGPYGVGNPGPRFALEHVTVVAADVVGNGHVRLRLKGRDGVTIKAMAFRAADEDMGQTLLTGMGRAFHVAGRIRKDDWSGGGKAELHIDDAFLIGPP